MKEDHLQRVRAVKIVQADGKSGEWSVQAILLREAGLLQDLKHHNIIRYYDFYMDIHFLYVVMELCTGGEVFAKSVGLESFTEADAAGLAAQMLSAIHYIHGRNIMHRDIKAENFMLSNATKKSVVKMIDFGLGCTFKPDQVFEIVVGTPLYMAPELVSKRYDYRVDVWAFGVLMYLLMYGDYPFRGDSDEEIMGLVLTEPIKWNTPQKFAPETLDFLKQLLVRNPNKRITTCEALNHPFVSVSSCPELARSMSMRSEAGDLKEVVRSAIRKVSQTKKKVDPEVEKLRGQKMKKINDDFGKGIRHGHRLGSTPNEDFMDRSASGGQIALYRRLGRSSLGNSPFRSLGNSPFRRSDQARSLDEADQAAPAKKMKISPPAQVHVANCRMRQVRWERGSRGHEGMQGFLSSLEDASRALKRPRPALPWELGAVGLVLGRTLPGGKPLEHLQPTGADPPLPPHVLVRSVPSALPAAAGSGDVKRPHGRPQDDAAFAAIVKKIAKVDWGMAEKTDVKRQLVLERLKGIVMQAPEGSVTGRQLLEAASSDDVEAEVHHIITNTFASRKLNTLQVRTGSLAMYVRWFFRSKHDPNLPAHGGADEVLQSARVTGSTLRQYMTKRPLKQKDCLKVKQVKDLETFLAQDTVDKKMLCDQVGAGFFVLCKFGRARFSDAQSVEKLLLDVDIDGCGYLEASTLETKTSNRKNRRRRFLDMVAPANGLVYHGWATRWLQLRKRAGLLEGPGIPLLPAPQADGSWAQARLDAAEAAVWLRELLAKTGSRRDDLANVATHSAKATGLSWAAKYGVGEGNPDATRSGRWLKLRATALDDEETFSELHDRLEQDPIAELESSAGEDVSSDTEVVNTSDDDEEVDQAEVEARARADEVAAEALFGQPKKPGRRNVLAKATMFKHRARGAFHFGEESNEDVLACGRRIEPIFFVQLEQTPAFAWPRCNTCFGNQGAEDCRSQVARVWRQVRRDALRAVSVPVVHMVLGFAKMANLDSEAVFRARALAIGLQEQEVLRAVSSGWKTFAAFAFSCNHTPGSADETSFNVMAVKVVGGTAGVPEANRVHVVRRLFFEAFTLAAADLRRKVDSTDADAPRKLAAPERASRYAGQVAKLIGLVLEDELECSHALIDLAIQSYEDDVLTYIPWASCATRSQELMGVKKDPFLKTDANGTLKLALVDDRSVANLSTDLRIHRALQRRGLAYDQAMIVDFHTHEKWVQVLLAALARVPPEGYTEVKLEQLVNADKELFRKILSRTRAGIKVAANGSKPVQAAMLALADDVDVRHFLTPLPGRPAEKRPHGQAAEESMSMGKKKRARKAAQKAKDGGVGAAAASAPARGQPSSGKGPGKGKQQNPGPRMPKELEGMVNKLGDKILCYAFNINGCDNAKLAGVDGVTIETISACKTKVSGPATEGGATAKRGRAEAEVRLEKGIDVQGEGEASSGCPPDDAQSKGPSGHFGPHHKSWTADSVASAGVKKVSILPRRAAVRNGVESQGETVASKNGGARSAAAEAFEKRQMATRPSRIQGTDRTRVEKANLVFDFVAKFAIECEAQGVGFSVENPTRSHMWNMPLFQTLAQSNGVFMVTFHQCCHGGDRDKWSSWLTNVPALSADEAAYPAALCRRVAGAVREFLLAKGFKLQSVQHGAVPYLNESDMRRAGMQAGAGRQPRGRKFAPLVPEFKQVLVLAVEEEADKKVVKQWKRGLDRQTVIAGVTLPKEAKLIRIRLPEGGLRGSDAGADEDKETFDWRNVEGLARFTAEIGVPWSPEELLEKAKEAVHPVDGQSWVDDDTLRAIFDALTFGPTRMAAERIARLQRYKEMSADAGVRDKKLAEEVVRGFKMNVMAAATGEFPPRFRPPQINERELMSTAKWSRAVLLESIRSSGDDKLDREVYESTISERDAQWLAGPFSAEELSKRLGPLWILNRRFGLLQGLKCRNVDDMSENGTNSAFGSSEKIDLGGVDEIAAVIKVFAGAVKDDRGVKVTLADGAELAGWLAEDLSVAQARALQGRTLDLEAAYKQLLIAPESLRTAVVGVWNPVLGKAELFESRALPFGASASVTAFNRYARALRLICCRLFSMAIVNYFDDFPHVELESLANNGLLVVEEVFALLGVKVSLSAKKRKPLDTDFDALGVKFQLALLASAGKLVVTNTPERVVSLLKTLDQVLQSGTLRPGEAAELRGKLLYAEAQTFGRVARAAMHPIGLRSLQRHGHHLIDSVLSDSLNWMQWHLRHAKPREIDCRCTRPPVIVLTDGACESVDGMLATCGGIMLDPENGEKRSFGFKMHDEVTAELQAISGAQIIGQAELLPVLVAKRIWAKLEFTEAERLGFVRDASYKRNLANQVLLAHLDDCRQILSANTDARGQAECTVINFTVTEQGLEEFHVSPVCCGWVAGGPKGRIAAWPDLAKTKSELIQQQNEFKVRLADLESYLLEKLAGAEGDILEDTELVFGLEDAKFTSDDVKEKVKLAQETEAKINVISENYRPTANRGALLFFLMMDLCKMHTFYKYSLDAFVMVVTRAVTSVTLRKPKEKKQVEVPVEEDPFIEKNKGSAEHGEKADTGEDHQEHEHAEGEVQPEVASQEEEEEEEEIVDLSGKELTQRVSVLEEVVTIFVFSYLRRGLLDADKLTVASMLALRILVRSGAVQPAELNLLIRAPLDPNAPPMPETTRSWLTEPQWAQLKSLEQIPAFKTSSHALTHNMEQDSLGWKRWFAEERAEASDLPRACRDLGTFHRLFLLRVLRPDRI
ncbi:unnamed protein product, partial [Polarella glacialis]